MPILAYGEFLIFFIFGGSGLKEQKQEGFGGSFRAEAGVAIQCSLKNEEYLGARVTHQAVQKCIGRPLIPTLSRLSP